MNNYSQAQVRNPPVVTIVNPDRAWEGETPPPDFVIPGLEVGTVGIFIATGGSGKSNLAIALCRDIAIGKDLLKLTGKAGPNPFVPAPQTQGTAVYVTKEETPNQVTRRTQALAKKMEFDDIKLVKKHMGVVCISGYVDLLHDREAAIALLKRLATEAVAVGARLLVIDTMRRFHTGEEISSEAMAQVLEALEEIARDTGAAVLILHHCNKQSVLMGSADSAAAARGSTTITDNARFVMYASRMTAEESAGWLDGGMDIQPEDAWRYVRVGVAKCNYAAPIPERWYISGEHGTLTPISLVKRQEAEDAGVVKKTQRQKPSSAPKKSYKRAGVQQQPDLPGGH